MLGEKLENVRKVKPLVHNITNNVTVNDVANILLAIGASPIMADGDVDAQQITNICDGLNINIGTLNENTRKVMLSTGIEANKLGHPILLDPVGVGASKYRDEFVNEILDKVRFDVIRGNISEIKSIVSHNGNTRGVDASDLDKINNNNLTSIVSFAKSLSAKLRSIIVITGEIDIVANDNKAYIITNGTNEMSRITGTGCQLSALITAFIIANPDSKLDAVAAAVCCMGLAGEIGKTHMLHYEGNSSYRNRIIDAVYNMRGIDLDKGAKYEIK